MNNEIVAANLGIVIDFAYYFGAVVLQSTSTNNNRSVYNGDINKYDFNTISSYAVFAVDYYDNDSYYVRLDVRVQGHSNDLAIKILDYLFVNSKPHNTNVMYTGCIESGQILPNPYFSIKDYEAEHLGMKLYGVNKPTTVTQYFNDNYGVELNN